MAPVLQEIISSLGFKIHIAENITNKTGKTMDPFQTNLTSWELRGQKVPLELEWLERASSGQIETLRAWRRHSSWRNSKKEQEHKTRKPENLPRNNYESRTSLAWLPIKTFNSGTMISKYQSGQKVNSSRMGTFASSSDYSPATPPRLGTHGVQCLLNGSTITWTFGKCSF